jgi:hypothetical protein
MKEVDQKYGPLEWRLPEAHAIYWAAMGLKKAQQDPDKIPKKDDLITLRRVIYQSMQLSFQRGKLVTNPFAKAFEFGPNLAIIPKVSAAYEQAADEDEPNRDHILRAHRNFLRDAIYFLYSHNRVADAAYWYKYNATHYPDRPILDYKTNSLPRNLTLDQYAVARVQEDINETSPDRVKAAIEGLIVNAYRSLVLDEDERYAGFKLLARQIWNVYMEKIPKERIQAIGLRPLDEINNEMLNRLLDPEHGVTPEERAVLRTKLGMEKEKVPPAAPTAVNAPEKLSAKQ